MLKTLVLAGVALLLGAFLITATVDASAGQTDELIIPLNAYVNFSNNLTVHIIQVTLSNITYYSTYTPDPMNTTWPIILFQYENHGEAQVACRFHVEIVDNSSAVPAGWKYDKTDEALYQPLYPGQKSSVMTMEFAMPKGHVLTNLSIIDDGIHEEVARIPIFYTAPTITPTPAMIVSDVIGDDSFRNLMIIPILLGLAGLIGWLMARKRLF